MQYALCETGNIGTPLTSALLVGAVAGGVTEIDTAGLQLMRLARRQCRQPAGEDAACTTA